MKNILFTLISVLIMTNLEAQTDKLPGNTSLPSTDEELIKLASL